jgi:four helix bundle protein
MNDESAQTDLMKRTKQFALRVIRMYTAVRRSDVGRVLGHQALRSGTSVGAHYREAHRARSTAEFISKIEGALQELDETRYWFELIIESSLVRAARLQSLQIEASEMSAILTASAKTAKRRRRNDK